MCILLEEKIFLGGGEGARTEWCSAVWFHGIAVRINRKPCVVLSPVP